MKVVLCHGAFDVLHIGHLAHFGEASRRVAMETGNDVRLVVSLSADAVVRARKPGRPIHLLHHRMEMVRALRCVAQVYACYSMDGSDAIIDIKPDYFVKGRDYKLDTLSEGERDACKEVGARVFFTTAEKRSSTDIIERLRAA